MRPRTLAHLSDLHLGRSPETDRAAVRLRDLVEDAFDHVVVSGDVTHRGRALELARFEELFGALQRAGRLSVVPGNHDRLGDDVGARLMRGGRVEAHTRDGLYVVRVDSTGPHNRFLLAGHGAICADVIEEIELALAGAPRRHLTVLTLHHHPLPLPEETFGEVLASRLGWPNAAELRLGARLLERIASRCDVVLHGHRHVPSAMALAAGGPRPLAVYNAGSSTTLGRFRVFTHLDGVLVGPPVWLDTQDVPAFELAGTGTE